MSRDVLPLTLDRLGDLAEPCVACRFWELSPADHRTRGGDPLDNKRGWLTTALLEWGAPGRVAYVDGRPAGFVTFAPAPLVPRAAAFPTAPVSEDAIVLVTARIRPEYAGQGLGRVLVQAAAKDAVRRGVRAMEAFGRGGASAPPSAAPGATRLAAPGGATGGTPTGAGARGSTGTGPCLLPVDFLAAVGFYTVRDHPAYPRVRLDLRTVLRWRSEVEQAVERLFTPVRSLGAPQPVGTAQHDAP